MTAVVANPNNVVNKAVKDLTETQIQIAQDLIVKHKITDPSMAAAVMTNLALNFQAMYLKK